MSNASLISLCPPVRDQRQTFAQSCGGYACANAMSILHFLERKTRQDFSPLFIWMGAKWIDQSTGDVPTYGKSLMESLRTFGALPDRYGTRYRQNADTVPTTWEMVSASRFRPLHTWSMHVGPGDIVDGKSILEQVRGFLSVRRPVVFNIKVDAAFLSLRSMEPWKTVEGSQPLYGHYVCAVDDDRHDEAVTFINSVGDGWGQNGFGRVAYDSFRSLACSDAWALDGLA